ncbi:MAG: flagellar basal body-associated FliL family protein [bacterium]|nr:flagellar basal body-associated FliL family protein [bacterium]
MGDDELTGAGEDMGSSKGGMKNIIIIAAIALVMGVGGFFAGKMLDGGNGNDNPPVVKKTDGNGQQTGQGTDGGNQTGTDGGTDSGDGDTQDSGQDSKPKGKSGILALDTFTVNLNDPFGRRYIEVVLKLVINPKDLVPKIKENELLLPKIRHEVFMTISAKSYSELKSTSGKVTLFEEIQMRVNELIKEEMNVEPVTEVLQTKFLIQ